jgi:hypothetical protein
MAAVIQLRPAPKPAKAKPRKRSKVGRTTYRRQLLDMLCEQSRRALAGDWSNCEALRALAAAARGVGPKAQRVIWSGVSFPMKRGWIDSVRCPATGMALVGVL